MLGFLYLGYKRRFAFWETIVFFRKVLLVAITVFVRDGFVQVYLAACAFTVFLTLHVFVRPYGDPETELVDNSEPIASPSRPSFAKLPEMPESPDMKSPEIPSSQLSLSTATSLIASVAKVRRRGNNMEHLNILETVYLCSVLVTMWGCLMYDHTSTANDYITVVLLLVNAASALMFIRCVCINCLGQSSIPVLLPPRTEL